MAQTIPEIVQTLNSAMRDLNEALMPLFQMMRPVETVTVASQWVATEPGVTTTALPTAPKRKPGRPRKRVRPAPAQAALPEATPVSIGLTSPEEPFQTPYRLNIPKLEEPVDVMMGPQADVIMAPQAPPKVASPARQFQGKWMAATRKLSDTDKIEAKRLRELNPAIALSWAQGRPKIEATA